MVDRKEDTMAPNPSLAINVIRETSLISVTVKGEMDITNADGLPLCSLFETAGAKLPIHLDLTGVTYMDSTALQRVMRLNHEAQAAGVALVVYVREHSLTFRMMRTVGACDILKVMTIPAPVGMT